MSENRQKRNIKINKEKPVKPQKEKKKRGSFKHHFKNFKKLVLDSFKGDNSDNKTSKSNLELVKGSRKKKLIIRIVVYSLIVALIITILVINYLTPTGLVEKLQNDYAASGKGEYPINIYAQNPNELISNCEVSLILNNTYFEVYNKDGKLINAASHGMFEPELKVSEARFLLFDRDRYSVKVYNYSNELYERTFEKNIYCADIGRDGTFAVVTSSDTHNNTVSVFNKNNEQVYTWNSADNYIVDVAVSNDGDSIALCLVDALSGSFVSKVYILEYDSATPVWKAEINTFVSSITSVNEKYFLLTGVDAAYTVDWEGGYREHEISGVVRCYNTDITKNCVYAFGREDNEHDNSIVIIGEDGSKYSEFEFSAPISDIAVNGEKIAVLSSDTVYVYDLDGTALNTYKSDTKPLFVTFTADGKVTVTDNTQLKLLLSED